MTNDTIIESPDEVAPASQGVDDTAADTRPAEGRRPPRGGPRPDRPKRRDVNGWVILDKGVGMTSTHAVAVVKRAFNAKKAGHAGTLDPLASGILPIALGEATKTVPFVMDGRKAYVFTVTWGIETDTDDAEGRPVATSDARPERGAVEAALPNFVGAIEQVPPRYSAIKIAGERAYDLARDGEEVVLVARPVQIDHLAVVEHDGQRTVIEAQCGKGTYVRALARDFGRDLGCFGHVSELRRSFVAPFAEEAMVPLATLVALEEIEDDEERLAALDAFLIDTGEALSSLPHIVISDDQAHRLKMGNPILLRGRDAPVAESEAYATVRGKLVAIGEIGAGEFRPKRVFV